MAGRCFPSWTHGKNLLIQYNYFHDFAETGLYACFGRYTHQSVFITTIGY